MAKKKASKKKATKKFTRKKTSKKFVNPEDVVIKLEQNELLLIGKLSAEIREALANAKYTAAEMGDIKRNAEAMIASKEATRQELLAEAKRIQGEYGRIMEELASKYGVDDPKHMLIDPVTGVVRDPRGT